MRSFLIAFALTGCTVTPTGPSVSDTDPGFHVEDCIDGVDNDNNGLLDCGDPSCESTCDVDGDGFDAIAMGGSDCDDKNGAVHPDAIEFCDDLDNDCDGLVDAEDPDVALTAWHPDDDGDTYGDPNQVVFQCEPPPGPATQDDGDCDDDDPDIHPQATEFCNGEDDDCDGLVDDDDPDLDPLTLSTWWPDADGDGFGDFLPTDACVVPPGHTDNSEDCDDGNGDIHPDATEICDGADTDCNGAIDDIADLDGDGYVACGLLFDCADDDLDTYPGAPELCDGLDNDCDGIVPGFEIDADGDGVPICGGDCDDSDPLIAQSGEWFLDGDGDGHGAGLPSAPSCTPPGPDWVAYLDGDCDDGDPAIYPGAPDIIGDGIDQDCDGQDGACIEIAIGYLPQWGPLTYPDLAWNDVIATAPTLGNCPLRFEEISPGFTFADLQAANVNVLWSTGAATIGIEYTAGEMQAITDFVNAGGGIVTSYTFNHFSADNSELALLVGIDPAGFSTSQALCDRSADVLEVDHPIARDVDATFDLTTYSFVQDSWPSIDRVLLPDTEVVIASQDALNLVVAYDNGQWRGVAFTSFPEFFTLDDNVHQVMYNAAAWAAGFDAP